MHPILFKIGPFTIHTYGVMLTVAFVVGLALTVRQARKEGIAPEKIVDLGFYLLLSAIVGSRLHFTVFEYRYYLDNPLRIFKIWEGGLILYGGVILSILTGIYYIKKKGLPLWKVADISAPYTALSIAIGRLGCFSSGCCYGKETHIPWAVTFRDPHSLARLNLPLHPTQLYESGGTFIIFLFLIVLRKRKDFDGQLFWLFIFLYVVLRSILEFFRAEEVRRALIFGMSHSQLIGIPLAVFAIYMLFRLKKRTVY